MTDYSKDESTLAKLMTPAMDALDVAVTLTDPQGILLYYNRQASRILDRKPEYIGTDANDHHKKPSSNEKFKSMLDSFRAGRTEPYRYQAKPYGKPLEVTFAPILKDGVYIGCVQTARPAETTAD